MDGCGVVEDVVDHVLNESGSGVGWDEKSGHGGVCLVVSDD